MQCTPHSPGTPVLMQVNDIIIMFLTKAPHQLFQVSHKLIYLINMGIRGIDRLVRRLGQHMQFHVRQLLTDATDDRRSQYDVANGTESDDKNLFQNVLFLQQR